MLAIQNVNYCAVHCNNFRQFAKFVQASCLQVDEKKSLFLVCSSFVIFAQCTNGFTEPQSKSHIVLFVHVIHIVLFVHVHFQQHIVFHSSATEHLWLMSSEFVPNAVEPPQKRRIATKSNNSPGSGNDPSLGSMASIDYGMDYAMVTEARKRLLQACKNALPDDPAENITKWSIAQLPYMPFLNTWLHHNCPSDGRILRNVNIHSACTGIFGPGYVCQALTLRIL